MLTRQQAIDDLTGPGGPFELVTIDDGRGPERIYAGPPDTLREVLIASRAHGARDFLIYEDERISYAEHFVRVARLAHWLKARGVAKGDRVAIAMRNYPEWSIAFFACHALGAVAVTLNAWWTGRELVYGLTDSGARIAIVDGERLASLADHRDALPAVAFLVARDAEPCGADATRWSDALAEHADRDDLPPVDLTSSDPASIMYTSGTTGLPKGALHLHRNHVTNIRNALLGGAVAALLRPQPVEQPDAQPSALQSFPFFHIGGLSGLYITLATGGRLSLMYKWDARRALALIRAERVTSWSAVPTLVRELLEHPEADADALASLGSIASGGAPVPADLIGQIGARFEARVAPGNGYGATETTSAIISNSGPDYLERPRSVGRPAVTADVRIVAEDGSDCPPGAVGELWARGPNIFAGYWGKPDATAEAFSDGWFRTGDLGFVDDDGFYYVVDRKKDVIIRAGENVYCAEVEGVLHELPAVVDVALIGLPHRSLGEEVAAVIECAPGATLDEAGVQAFVASRLARYNVPTKVFFITEPLPRTATGKILKRELRQRYAG